MLEVLQGKGRNDIVSILRDVDISDAKFHLEKSESVVIYKDNSGKICGCATFWLWGENKNKADLYVYVIPEMRRKGIGRALYRAIMDIAQQHTLTFISTKIETNHEQSLSFFQNAGFEKWYTELFLYHSGQRQPESDLRLVNYNSEYFTRYIDAIRNSFFQLRQANDFQPYYCCEPCEEKKREFEENKDNIFLLTDGENIAASVIVNADSVDDVFVTPAYQGRGIGKKLMQFAVNKAIDKNCNPIKLSAIEWNARALHLYESVGFHINNSATYMRLFL